MPAPTIKDAFNNRLPGNYYEFRSPRVVIHRFILDGQKVTTYWINDRPETCTNCDGTTWSESYDPSMSFCCAYCVSEYELEPIPCRICGGDCRGCDYEKWGFCTRSCMVEATRDY